MKYTVLTDQLFAYMDRSRTDFDDQVLNELREETKQFGENSVMQIGNEQGTFLTILTRLIEANKAIEIGTFTGHSSICIARGLPDNGRLCCLDASDEWTSVAKKYWAKAGLENKIDLFLGDALNNLAQLSDQAPFDLAFIDADKVAYEEYYEAVLPLIRKGGVILFDNMFRGGCVLDDNPDEGTKVVIRINEKLANDPRVETVLLPIGDGVQVTRKV